MISKEILHKCKNRDSILKCISNEKDQRDSKKAYYTAYFEKNKYKSSEIWKGIRSLVNINSTTSFNIKLLDENKLIINPKKISNIFNDHFSTLGSKIEQKIPFELGNYKNYFNKKDKNGNLFINSANSFFLSPTNPSEIEKIINDLDIKKSIQDLIIYLFSF